MNKKIEESVKQMSEKVTMTDKNQLDWFEGAVRPSKKIQFNLRKLSISIAATLCVVALCGFAYKVLSETFYKIFVVSEHRLHDLEKAYDEFENSGELEIFLSKLLPSEMATTEYKSSVGKIDITAIKGDNVDNVSYSFNNDMTSHRVHFHDPSKNVYIIQEEMIETVDQYAENGNFIAALDPKATGYEFDTLYSLDGKLESVAYKVMDDTKHIYIRFGYANSYWMVKEDANVSTEDIDINGKTFMYVENARYENEKALVLYLGDDKYISHIEITGDENTTKDELIEAAKYLIFYNETANPAKESMEITDYSDISYEVAKEIIHLPESPFDGYEWFPSDRFNHLSFFKSIDGYITGEFDFSKNSSEICKLTVSRIYEMYMPVIETKLDALLCGGVGDYDEIIEINGEYFGVAYEGKFSKDKVMISTVVEQDGDYYYYELLMAKSLLSGSDAMVWLSPVK